MLSRVYFCGDKNEPIAKFKFTKLGLLSAPLFSGAF